MQHATAYIHSLLSRVGIVEGLGLNPQFMSTDAHFRVKIGFKFQSMGKISNISAADPPLRLGQFQHCSHRKVL